jgi:hypothetical protein
MVVWEEESMGTSLAIAASQRRFGRLEHLLLLGDD